MKSDDDYVVRDQRFRLSDHEVSELLSKVTIFETVELGLEHAKTLDEEDISNFRFMVVGQLSREVYRISSTFDRETKTKSYSCAQAYSFANYRGLRSTFPQ